MQRILVIDDSISTLKQIAAFLEGHYEVVLAKTVISAFEICIVNRPDIILLDINMPDMNGFETISRLKENAFLHRIPVIFLTASYDVSVEVKAFDSGARDIISKPVEPSILRNRIALHLRLTSYQAKTETLLTTLADNIATSFAELIERRDENTGGHVTRTSKIVGLLGQDLINRNVCPKELHQEELRLIVRAAPLHDLGKIAVSDKVLLKPGKLNDEEFNEVKNHTIVGRNLINQLYLRMPTQEYLHYAGMVALSHHEHYDGHGYPQGLKGEEIPLCARIMSVADVYDAVTMSRVYRKGMGHLQAKNIIMDGRGSHFDPMVIDSFENVFKEIVKEYDVMPQSQKLGYESDDAQ
ncbi:MAG: response regulator [Spirochaetes bacterium]|nr:response regulator [Spirochaetota bacterium]